MRVGLLIYGDLETRSGGYTYDRKLVEYLKSKGDTVVVFSIPWRNYVLHLTDNFKSALLQKIIRADLDILIQDELNHPSLVWWNRRLKQKINVPIVSIIHHLRCKEKHPRLLSSIYAAIERVYLKSLDAWIVVSETTLADASALAGKSSPYILANPSALRWQTPLTPEDIRKRTLQSDPLKIIFLANLIERKGLHVLLKALAKIPKNLWQLDIIGGKLNGGRYANMIHKLTSELDLLDNVNFKGWLDDEDLENHLQSQDVLCVPSSYEGFGMVYLEGMGLGLPAIASTSGAAKEIITHGENGFLIDYGDATALAERFVQLQNNRALLTRMSLAASDRYKQQLTWEETGERIRTFLNTLVQQRTENHP